MLTATLALVIIATIGFIAQRVGICLVKASDQALRGDPALLLAILMSGCWLWVYFVIATQWQLDNPMLRYAFHPLFFVGGFVFGIGAGVNQACSVSTMNRFTKGDLAMMFTMMGWFLGWCLWTYQTMEGGLPAPEYEQTPQLSDTTIILLFVPALSIALYRLVFRPHERGLWFGIMTFGMLTSALFVLQPDWAPSQLIQDTGGALLHEGASWPELQRYLLVLSLFAGMWLAAIVGKQFHLRHISPWRMLRHTAAGCLMGIGAAIALGGNDAHLLLGLPTLSLASIATIAGMLSGISLERWIYRRYFLR